MTKSARARMPKPRGTGRKHVPLRTCVACQLTRPKQELIRVVRTRAGTIEIDPRGKLPGRGAYVCRTRQCWQIGLEPKKLERVLKCQVSAEDVLVLRMAAVSLLEGPDLSASAGNAKVDVTDKDDAHASG